MQLDKVNCPDMFAWSVTTSLAVWMAWPQVSL
jgi:hypothetical protein